MSIEIAESSENEKKLQILNDKLSFINEQIMVSESSKKTMFARRRTTANIADEYPVKFNKLKEEMIAFKQRFEAAYHDYTENEKCLAQEKLHYDELLKERDDVMSQIRELTVISLYCGDSVANDKTFDYRLSEQNIDNIKINERFISFFESDLSKSGLLDDYSVSSLKLAAKIIIACEALEEENSISVELYFDDKNKITELLEFMGKNVKVIL